MILRVPGWVKSAHKIVYKTIPKLDNGTSKKNWRIGKQSQIFYIGENENTHLKFS
jgi:hypothetical protein